jgi:hypothetical protein
VLVTGSRKWKDRDFAYATLDTIYECWLLTAGPDDSFIIVQGEAPGLDTIAKQWAQERHQEDPRVDHEDYRAQWDLYGKAAGHIRNDEMVHRGADICVGFPTPDSIGTYDCLTQARKANILTFDMSEYL